MIEKGSRVKIKMFGGLPDEEGTVLDMASETLCLKEWKCYEVRTDRGPIIKFHESWIEELA